MVFRWRSGKCDLLPVIKNSAFAVSAHSKKRLSEASSRQTFKVFFGETNLDRDLNRARKLPIFRGSKPNLGRRNTRFISAKIGCETATLTLPCSAKSKIAAGRLSAARRPDTITLVSKTTRITNEHAWPCESRAEFLSE